MLKAVCLGLVVSLTSFNAQQIVPDLNVKELVENFMLNFPEAFVERNAGDGTNIIGDTILKYYMPLRGFLLLPYSKDTKVGSDITISGKSFIGGTMEITVATFIAKNDIVKAIVGGNGAGFQKFNSTRSVNGSINIDEIYLQANIRQDSTGYNINGDLKIIFLPVNTDLPYNITTNDRVLAGRIKDWLNNNLPAVVEKYEEYLNTLVDEGFLEITESLL